MGLNFCQSFTANDKEQTQRWLDWVSELGGMGRHKLFLMPCCHGTADFKTNIPFTVVPDSFNITSDWSTGTGTVRSAAGANTAPRQFAWKMHLEKLGAWMFIEPDCIPLRSGWHDELEDEYLRAGKPFMAARVRVTDVPEHPTGNCIFHQDTAAFCHRLMLPVHAVIDGREVELAFDVACAPDVMGEDGSGNRFHETRLIQHFFRGPKFEKMDHLARIDPAACVFHTDKDGGLINLLRRQRGGEAVTQQPHAGSIPAPATPVPAMPAMPASIVKAEPSKPRVHTYFRPCVDPEALAEQKRILAIWQKNWSDHGWEPVILTEEHAKKHPNFLKLEIAFEAMPTASVKEYEMACWLRWIAMTTIGGSLMVDYDVLVNGDVPLVPVIGILPLILSDNNPVPCAVFGTVQQYQNAIDAFLTCPPGEEQGQPHLSDMLAVQYLKFPAKDVCREHGTAEWEKAPLIHFNHRRCGTKRSVRMQAFMDGTIDVKDVPGPEVEVFSDAYAKVLEDVRPWIGSKNPSVADCIDQLVLHSKRDGFAKGRIIKQLRKAGFIPSAPRKK